jgi:hypothetical protein
MPVDKALAAKLPKWDDVTGKAFTFPALAGWISKSNTFGVIRSLTPEEAELVKAFGKTYSAIEQRMNLLRITHRNFEELSRFTQCEGVPFSGSVDYKLELDRLILNFLSAAYGLHEQFKTHLGKQSDTEQAEFRQFVAQLEDDSFAYAFFRDFRNYAQHCELPVGTVNVHKTLSGTTMQVKHRVEDLLRDYKNWGKSKLWEKFGELDLVELATQYHEVLMTRYGNYISNYFLKPLFPIHEFAARLTAEVKAVNPEFEMTICTRASGDGVTNAQWSCVGLPEDVFGSLGISVTPKSP